MFVRHLLCARHKTNNDTERCWPVKYSLKHGQNAICYKLIVIAVVNISGLWCALVHIP